MRAPRHSSTVNGSGSASPSDRVFEARGVRLLFFRIGGVTVEIASSLAGGGADDGDRLWGMSYKVADVAAARQRVAEAGFEVSEVRGGTPSPRNPGVHGARRDPRRGRPSSSGSE